MPDYRCPACRGGFPAAAADDDACPWCGEAMDGDGGGGGSRVVVDPRPGLSTGVGPLDPDLRQPFDERDLLGDHRQLRMQRSDYPIDETGDPR